MPKIIINKNLNLYFVKDFSYVSLTPIIPTNKVDFLFKLYKIPESKEEISTKIKNYINKQESKIDKIYMINDIKVHKSRGNITIIDEQFNKKCLLLSKQSKDAMQIIADKIALALFNNKKIIYKYEKNEQEKMVYVVANLKIDENISVKSDLFESEKNARNDVNKKIIIKYLHKRLVKEIMNNIIKNTNLEDKIKFEKKERYEKHLLEAGNDRKLLNKKRNLTIEEFSQRLPYYNMLQIKKKKLSKNVNISLDEENENFFVNTSGTPLNEILLGDPNIVDNHLRDFKYTPFKLFEMIRDSEKTRGVDLRIEFSSINDKNLSVKFLAVIISQKLGIKVEGYGNSKEEAGNKCSLNLLTILFKNTFRTYHLLHDYFEHKNKRYLDIILKNENEDENGRKKGKYNRKKKSNKIENKTVDNNNKKNDNFIESIQRSQCANWKNYSYKRSKIIDDDEYWYSKEKSISIKNKKILNDYNGNELAQQNYNENKSGQKSSNESQESCFKFDFEQANDSEFINNTSNSDINIITNLNNYHSSDSSNTDEIEDFKNSGLGLSASNYSMTNGSKKK